MVICDSSIQVKLPLGQKHSSLHDLHWTSIGFRAVIFRSPLCLVWMPVETLIQPIEQDSNMVPWAGAKNPIPFNLQPSRGTSTIFRLPFYEAQVFVVKLEAGTLRSLKKRILHVCVCACVCVCVCVCEHVFMSALFVFIPLVPFIGLNASRAFLLTYKQSFTKSMRPVNVQSQ